MFLTYDLPVLHSLEVMMPTIAVLIHVLRFPPTNCYDITEILLKVVLNTNNTISIPTITRQKVMIIHVAFSLILDQLHMYRGR